MGVCAVFLYFPASSRILATMSREHSGSVLGKYYGFGGLLTSVLDLAATAIYARVESEIFLFRGIMLFFAVVNLVTGTLIGLKFWNQKTDIEKGNPVRLRDVSAVLRQPKVWLIALITMCNYLICCLMSYYTPYLTGVFGVSESYALLIAVIRLGVFSLAAGLIWGKWTDRIGSATRVIRFSFVLLAVLFAGLLVNDRWGRSSIAVILITFGIALISLGNKSMTLVLFTEKQISPRVLGTAIGIVSFIGYSPDAFFYPAAGKILEQTGDGAYAILFLIGIAAALIGMLCGNTLIQKLPD
jgi:predicted MFS family arabinose efflux permease